MHSPSMPTTTGHAEMRPAIPTARAPSNVGPAPERRATHAAAWRAPLREQSISRLTGIRRCPLPVLVPLERCPYRARWPCLPCAYAFDRSPGSSVVHYASRAGSGLTCWRRNRISADRMCDWFFVTLRIQEDFADRAASADLYQCTTGDDVGIGAGLA